MPTIKEADALEEMDVGHDEPERQNVNVMAKMPKRVESRRDTSKYMAGSPEK